MQVVVSSCLCCQLSSFIAIVCILFSLGKTHMLFVHERKEKKRKEKKRKEKKRKEKKRKEKKRKEKKRKEKKRKEKKRKEKKRKEKKRKEKTRLDYAFWHQFNEKPSITPGCPGQALCTSCPFQPHVLPGIWLKHNFPLHAMHDVSAPCMGAACPSIPLNVRDLTAALSMLSS